MSAVTIEERGRNFQLNESSSFTRQYYVRGATDEAAATASVLSYLTAQLGAALTLGGLELKSISGAEEVEDGYRITASWGTFQRREPLASGESSFSFEIGIEPVKVLLPIATTVYKRASDTDPTPTGFHLIGDQGDGEEPAGVEIYEPQHTESETHIFPASSINSAYKNAVKRIVGKTNKYPFKGNDIGECLMQSVSGSQRGASDWELTFKWAVKENINGETISGITGINRRGWEYVWPKYELAKDSAGAPVLTRQIRYIVKNQVFREADFTGLQIGTT